MFFSSKGWKFNPNILLAALTGMGYYALDTVRGRMAVAHALNSQIGEKVGQECTLREYDLLSYHNNPWEGKLVHVRLTAQCQERLLNYETSIRYFNHQSLDGVLDPQSGWNIKETGQAESK